MFAAPIEADALTPAETTRTTSAWQHAPVVASATIAAWNDLVADSADRNVFAEPWLLNAGMAHCRDGHEAMLAMPRDASGRAIGLFALKPVTGFGRMALPGLILWRHPNCFVAPAIARRGDEAAAWAMLIELAATATPRSRYLAIDGVVDGSAIHHGLIAAASQHRIPIVVDGRYERAAVETELDAETYWASAVRAKKRKELRRQWARLGELGVVTTDRLDRATPIGGWIDEFLTLEASGWKGANRSALASNPDTRAFFAAAMADGHALGKIAITALRLDGRAIAMLITLISGDAGFSFKTAFDEDFSRFSPGVLLQRESLDLLQTRQLRWIDSCAAPDHPMIDSLWHERRTMLRLLLPLPGAANRTAFAAARGVQRLWHGAKALVPSDRHRRAKR